MTTSIDLKDMLHFKKLEDSLSTERGCLLFCARLVIPGAYMLLVILMKLGDKVLELIHLGHFGMRQMKQLSRSAVYWLNINDDMELMC